MLLLLAVLMQVFSLEYCAPEVAEAVARGDRAMVACGAADMWAVGVIAYQLATGAAHLQSACIAWLCNSVAV
jgi:hypothetical protein